MHLCSNSYPSHDHSEPAGLRLPSSASLALLQPTQVPYEDAMSLPSPAFV